MKAPASAAHPIIGAPESKRDYRVPFNVPTHVQGGRHHVEQALQDRHLCGDGPYTRRCASLLQERLGSPGVFMTATGTSALECAVLMLNLGAGDEVIMPSFNYIAAPSAVMLHGGRPVFADISADTLTLDLDQVESAITSRTRAILPVHYGPAACPLDDLQAIAERHGLSILEDAAHGLFGKDRDRYLGTRGRFGVFSFHSTKNLTCGEGGALLVNNHADLEAASCLYHKGTNRLAFERGDVPAYMWIRPSGSYQLADVPAAMLYAQLEEAGAIQARRAERWGRYHSALGAWAARQGVALPPAPAEGTSSYHNFWLLMPDKASRDTLMQHCRGEGVQLCFHYPALHLSPFAQQAGLSDCVLPVTEHVAEALVRLPLYDDLSFSLQDHVIESIMRAPC